LEEEEEDESRRGAKSLEIDEEKALQ